MAMDDRGFTDGEKLLCIRVALAILGFLIGYAAARLGYPM